MKPVTMDGKWWIWSGHFFEPICECGHTSIEHINMSGRCYHKWPNSCMCDRFFHRESLKPRIAKMGCYWVVLMPGHEVYGWSYNQSHVTWESARAYLTNQICYFVKG